MSLLENIDKLTPEELLAPPKLDILGVLMVFLTALIVGALAGVIILIFLYFTVGRFSLETGASPMLLAMITFFALSIGNILSYTIRARIFPHIYTRSRTAFSQIVGASILLYIIFAPLYLFISDISPDKNTILIAFSLHILLTLFVSELVIGIISHYRYALLVLYSSIISLLITACFLAKIIFSSSDSSLSLFILLSLTLVAYMITLTLSTLCFYLYSQMYRTTGKDPLGSVFARIEEDEKSLEQDATTQLTQFSK